MGASYGSIYPTLSDLVKRGLATKREDIENKRNKQIYTITDEGRKYLAEWIKLPVEKEMSYLIEAAENLRKCVNDDPAHKYYLLTVEFGIKTYSAYLEWCKEAKDILVKESE